MQVVISCLHFQDESASVSFWQICLHCSLSFHCHILSPLSLLCFAYHPQPGLPSSHVFTIFMFVHLEFYCHSWVIHVTVSECTSTALCTWSDRLCLWYVYCQILANILILDIRLCSFFNSLYKFCFPLCMIFGLWRVCILIIFL